MVETQRVQTQSRADIDRITFTRCAVRTATAVAADLGWLHDEFASDGIVVASTQDPVGGPGGRRSRGPRADFREGGNIPALWARSRGASTRLVGLTWADERQVILGRAGEGRVRAGDLRGLRIGIPHRDEVGVDFRQAMALRGFAGALSIAGLGLSDVELVAVDAESRSGGFAQVAGPWEPELEALRQHTVDAVYLKGAVAVEAVRQFGATVVVDLDRFPDRRVRVNNGTPRPITVDQRVLDERPDVVARFLAVLLQAADWARGHLEPAIDGDLHPSLSRAALRLLSHQHQFLLAQGFLAGEVDIESWIDPAPLGAARDIVEARRRYAEPESFSSGRAAHPSSCSRVGAAR